MKENRKWSLLVFCICVLLFVYHLCSCNNNSTCIAEKFIPVDVKSDVIGTPIRQSDFIDSIDYIKISEDAILGEICSIKYCNGKYYLHDADANALWVLSNTGEVISRINKQGRAKDEYLNLFKYDVDMRNGNIYIYDQTGKKMLCYSYEGEFIHSYKLSLNEVYRDFVVLPNGTLACCCMDYDNKGLMKRGVWIEDSTGNFIKYIYQPNSRIKRDVLYTHYFWRINEKSIGMRAEQGNDIIYHLDFTSDITAQFCIKTNKDYDRNWLSEEEDFSFRKPDGFYDIPFYLETQKYLILSLATDFEETGHYSNTNNIVLYDKETNAVRVAKLPDGYIPDKNYLSFLGSSDDRLFSVFNPSLLPEQFQKMFPELEGCNQSVIQVAYLKQ